MSANKTPEPSAASPRWGNGGGSCTCSGYARAGEPAVFDSSRCPIHAKPLPEAKPMLNEAVADESWIKAVAKRLLREHGETLRKLAEDD